MNVAQAKKKKRLNEDYEELLEAVEESRVKAKQIADKYVACVV